MKRQTIGIVAHVDAGKTTCIESMLFKSGTIRKMGRVDSRDTVLDYDDNERSHGITIYTKQAHFEWKDTEVYVIDTPGHVDFSAEMERALQVLDLAILVINGQDGVQSHTETIWQCLKHYHVPVVVFVNKMDISHFSQEELLNDLRKRCSDSCIAFDSDEREEELSLCSDDMLLAYEEGGIPFEMVMNAVYERKCFPVLYGSALKMVGIEELLDLIDSLTPERNYPKEFGARIYKIQSDDKNERLTHVKITGGSLKAKTKLSEEEKVDQIRIYQGKNYEMIDEAVAGQVVVLKGLESFEAGSGLGFEEDSEKPLLNAFMDYELVLPAHVNALMLTQTIKTLAEEDPQLEIRTDERTHKICVRIMGEMQMEVLQKKIEDRTGIRVGFSAGSIVYRETIRNSVDGAGHFEPLRHYAEVHVKLEPLPQGRGVEVGSSCSTDLLNAAFQRSIISVLERTKHKGVLTGSLLTDVRITLVAGKGHNKHTVGGDMRQASIRAVRQALMKAENVLLEPYYQFTLRLPNDCLSKALYDLDTKDAQVSIDDSDDEMMVVNGIGPVRTLINYQNEVTAYTRGLGRFACSLSGYHPVRNQEDIVASYGYDPEADVRNPVGSVFCAHGAGFYVPWNEADELMHVQLKPVQQENTYRHQTMSVSNDDLEHILKSATHANVNKDKNHKPKVEPEKEKKEKIRPKLPVLWIIDGYNMIYEDERLKEIAKDDLYNARQQLIGVLANYQAFLNQKMIVVFDGYMRQNNNGTVIEKNDLTIVYTKTDQTADAWIEKAGYDYQNRYAMHVVTSDALIQTSVFARGALRMSSRELWNRISLMDEMVEEQTEILLV